MTHRLLIANRGEIAIRIARSAWELGIPTVAVYSEDDAGALHHHKANEAHALRGSGPAAYMDVAQLISIAQATGCTLVHPGYGFLSEQPTFAQACSKAGLVFVGPSAEQLTLLGDKTTARQLAAEQNVPIIHGTHSATSLEEAQAFLASAATPIIIKALFGGGGRGMRVVQSAEQLAAAWPICQKESQLATGRNELYVEQQLDNVRHIEVQIAGDGNDVVHLFERDCSVQRNHQKIIELAPAPQLDPALRQRLLDDAVKLGRACRYSNVGTVEFLIAHDKHYFIEVNPRLQVEHTVTEEITGVDLVATQIELALGRTLSDLNLTQDNITTRGSAIQCRINAETLQPDGSLKPSSGTVTRCTWPSGRGIRVESAIAARSVQSPRFDSLLGKLVVAAPSAEPATLLRKVYGALCETDIGGVTTNIPLLQNIVTHPDFADAVATTRFIADHRATLTTPATHQQRFAATATPPDQAAATVLPVPTGTVALTAPMPGSVIHIDVTAGDPVAAGQQVALIEAMKMEAVIRATQGGIVHSVAATVNDVLHEGQPLLFMTPSADAAAAITDDTTIDLDHIRPDLADLFARRALGRDENRPKAVAKRRRKGQLTARENIANLVDPDTFAEYGSALIAAQRSRRSLDDLMHNTPADGLVTGIGRINGALFGDAAETRCMIMAYDYSVLAGTQGVFNHKKMDRLLKLTAQWQLPLVLYAEGGGGRPGDVDYPIGSSLDVSTFALFGKLSGHVPLVSIVSGYCFAGNAALAGASDIIIATENTSIGMGGPAMIEGGGLGRFYPRDVGPAHVQYANGVIDVLVKDEAEATRVAKQYVSYFQGTTAEWSCADQRQLRHAIPENRRRIYDSRHVIQLLTDTNSVLELKAGTAPGVITALIRVEGRPLGLIANNPTHLGGAVDSDASDKMAWFMQLCNTFGLPIVSLIDTPGFMVGPDAEATGTVKRASRLFAVGAALSVPLFAIVLRKAYGLGAQAMAAGSMHMPFFTIAWPTSEFGPMGLEGAVRLGFRKELEAVADPAEREALFQKMVAQLYERGKGSNVAQYMDIDEVIDPAETRRWIMMGIKSITERRKEGAERHRD